MECVCERERGREREREREIKSKHPNTASVSPDKEERCHHLNRHHTTQPPTTILFVLTFDFLFTAQKERKKHLLDRLAFYDLDVSLQAIRFISLAMARKTLDVLYFFVYFFNEGNLAHFPPGPLHLTYFRQPVLEKEKVTRPLHTRGV